MPISDPGRPDVDMMVPSDTCITPCGRVLPAKAAAEVVAVIEVVNEWRAHFAHAGVSARDLESLAERIDGEALLGQRAGFDAARFQSARDKAQRRSCVFLRVRCRRTRSAVAFWAVNQTSRRTTRVKTHSLLAAALLTACAGTDGRRDRIDMFTRTLRALRVIASGIALSACGSDLHAPLAGDAPVDAPAASLAASAEWELLRAAPFAEQPGVGSAFQTPDAIDPTVFDRLFEQSAGRISLRAVNVQEQAEYRVSVDAEELAEISLGAMAAGLHLGQLTDEPSTGDEAPGDMFPKGWSDNNDSRVRYNTTTSWPNRTVGTLFDGGGDCTGTRIGPRHVLTAAHCIYNRGNASWNNIAFKPGRNGNNSAPYGQAGAIWYWVPDAYINYDAGDGPLNAYDIGIIILNAPIGNGWMGYAAQASGFLNSHDLFMRGYPRCNTAGAPVGCQAKTLWGDVRRCEPGTYFSPDGDGWNREILTNCDGSDGQSGSSFHYRPADGSAVSIGVFSHHYCLGGCPGTADDDFPNVITRITPTYLDVINCFRAEYP